MTQQVDQYNELGQKFFKLRDYTPIPLILVMLVVYEPSVMSATIGTLLIVFGELFRIYSVAFIGSISRTRKDHTGSNLIDKGPFGWVRNPLYVGNFFISFGMGVFTDVAWFAILTAAAFAFQYFYIVKYEESVLREKFGEEYATYCQKVPAWIPRKLPRLAEIDWPDTFSPAIKSERRTLSTICALLLLMMIFS